MDNHIRYRGQKGFIPIVNRGDGGLKRISFALLFLEDGMNHEEHTGDEEVCLVILGGRCHVEAGGMVWSNIGARSGVFDGPAASVYVPSKSQWKVTASGRVEIAVCRVLADRPGAETVYIPPTDVKIDSRGRDNWQRHVHDIVDNDIDAANMLVGETFSPPGHWSSSPPHRHDIDNPPHETDHEEIYFFKVSPEQGFMVIRLYNDDRSLDKTMTVENNDTVIIKEGYHPVAAAPGYQGYYLWILAGRERVVRTHDDPAHAWLKPKRISSDPAKQMRIPHEAE